MRRLTLSAIASLTLAIAACGSSAPQLDTGKAHAAATRFSCPSQQAVSTAVGGRPVPKPKRTMQASLTILCSYASVGADPKASILIFSITFGTSGDQLEGIARTAADGKVSPLSGLGEVAFDSRSDDDLQVFAEDHGRSVSCSFGNEDHITAAQRVAVMTLFL